MGSPVTLVITYDPLENIVQFALRREDGRRFPVADGEKLKDYENTAGLFNLEGHSDKIFKYLVENFDGEPEVAIELDVPQIGYEKRRAQFDLFEKAVKNFNKSGSALHFRLFVKVAPSPNTDFESGDKQPPPKTARRTNIAVLGKAGSGKSELIKAMCKGANVNTRTEQGHDGTSRPSEDENGGAWHEVDGLEIEKYSVERTKSSIYRLVKEEGLDAVLYCLNFRTGKMEDTERDLIVELKREHPGLKVLAVVTECIDEEAAREFAQKISSSTKQTKVFTVLARELRCRAGFLEPFGLEELAREIHRGAPV